MRAVNLVMRMTGACGSWAILQRGRDVEAAVTRSTSRSWPVTWQSRRAVAMRPWLCGIITGERSERGKQLADAPHRHQQRGARGDGEDHVVRHARRQPVQDAVRCRRRRSRSGCPSRRHGQSGPARGPACRRAETSMLPRRSSGMRVCGDLDQRGRDIDGRPHRHRARPVQPPSTRCRSPHPAPARRVRSSGKLRQHQRRASGRAPRARSRGCPTPARPRSDAPSAWSRCGRNSVSTRSRVAS